MPETAPWKARPVFISSTFKDMHAERDHLRHHVFPNLAEKLRERRRHLETIDLRIGVETIELAGEEEKELQVLKVCLDEIERSRPFLIVLLGDRYGWIPLESRMKAAVQEAGIATEVAGKSVTALEIEYGVLLTDPAQGRRCLFFFRDPLPYDEMPPEIAERYSDQYAGDEAVRIGHARLVSLKESIENNPDLRGRVHHYRTGWDPGNHRVIGLDDFGSLVARTLWTELDLETDAQAQAGERTGEDIERDALAEFVEQRSRDFIGRDQIVRDLLFLARSPVAETDRPTEVEQTEIRLPLADPLATLSFTINCDVAGVVDGAPGRPATPIGSAPTSPVATHRTPAESPTWGACITGDPGSGKSAVFAHLYRVIRPEPGILLLAHAAGISARATSVDAMLRRWIGELSAFLQIADPLSENASAEDVENTFAALLGRTSARTRVLVLIDALNQFEPATRARFLTWLPGPWPPNARLIATTLAGDQAEALRPRPGVSHRELGPLSAIEAEAIARAVCKRHHRALNPQVLEALTEKQPPDGTAATGNPLWLTLAVEQLNLLDEDDFARADRQFTGTPEHRLHKLMLDVTGRMPPDVVGLYGWLLEQTEKVHGAPFARAFSDLIALSRFGWRESDLRRLVPTAARLLFPDRRLPDWDDLKLAALRRGFRAHIARRGAAEQWDFFHPQMREAIRRRNLADPDLARRIHSAIADHLEALPADDPLHQSERMFHLISADDRARAVTAYGGDASASNSQIIEMTGRLADFILAEPPSEARPHLDWVISLLREPVAMATVFVACARFITHLDQELASRTDSSTRLALFGSVERVLAAGASQNPSSVDLLEILGACLDRTSDLLNLSGDPRQALVAVDRAFAVQERVNSLRRSAVSRINLAKAHSRIADMLHRSGDVRGALMRYRAAMDLLESAAGMPQSESFKDNRFGEYSSSEYLDITTASCHEQIGTMLYGLGDHDGALEAYHRALEIRERLAIQRPMVPTHQVELSMIYTNISAVYFGSAMRPGDPDKALVTQRKALSIIERLAARDPANKEIRERLAHCHQCIGDVALIKKDFDTAVREHASSAGIREQLVAEDPSNSDYRRGLAATLAKLGSGLARSGQPSGASRAYQGAIDVQEALVASDHGNAVWKEDLAISYSALGMLHQESDDIVQARQAWIRCREVLRGMQASGDGLSPRMAKLLDHLDRILRPSGPGARKPPGDGERTGGVPHPLADANRAAELNIAHLRERARWKEELDRWKALPFWKRWRVSRPEEPRPPTGI